VAGVLAELKKLGDPGTRDELGTRYGITAAKAFGVSMAKIQSLAKRIGRDHALARALWDTGWYDARLLAAFVADPAALTSSQMDDWSRDFDNWAVVDTVCFKLFDRAPTPLAFAKVDQWSRRDGPRDEFVKRAGLALLACLALHDEESPDEAFASRLPLVERGAGDDRNFVKKAASWALKAVGARSAPLRAAATTLAARLAESPPGSPARWVGRDAAKALKR
jgi:3-methyladenine DNA glycosylase AlkD